MKVISVNQTHAGHRLACTWFKILGTLKLHPDADSRVKTVSLCTCRYVHMYTNCVWGISVVTGVPDVVPNVTIIDSTINSNGNNVTLTLSWGEPFNNLDPIVNYTVSCSGDVTCPPNFTITDIITRSYTITNLTQMTSYTFSVVATNAIGSGEAGVVMITTPPGEIILYMHNVYKTYCIF